MPKRACTECGVAFSPRTSGQKYCRRACSAKARNRRYYMTWRGRLKKRDGQSRYFQQHREELYARRAARMERYVAELLQSRFGDMVRRGWMHHKVRVPLSAGFGFIGFIPPEEFARAGARNLARVQHDWHGGLMDGPVGRDVYFPIDARDPSKGLELKRVGF